MAHIGIDIGTSNTLVALLGESGDPEICEIDGSRMVPSVLHFEEGSGDPVFGQAARDLFEDPLSDPARSFRRWKLRIGSDTPLSGERWTNGRGQSVPLTPQTLTTILVEKVMNMVTGGLGGETIESVLVTVPHGWRREFPERCLATREAAAQAWVGEAALPVRAYTVSEPVAAAAYWIHEYHQAASAKSDSLSGKRFLVCDVGGGTFDLSMVKAGEPGEPLDVVDATNNDFAGDFADALLCSWACEQFNLKQSTTYPTDAKEILQMASGWVQTRRFCGTGWVNPAKPKRNCQPI